MPHVLEEKIEMCPNKVIIRMMTLYQGKGSLARHVFMNDTAIKLSIMPLKKKFNNLFLIVIIAIRKEPECFFRKNSIR